MALKIFFIDEKYNFNNLFVNFEPEGRSPKISFYVNGEKLLIIQGDIYRKFVSECNSPDIFVNYNINQKYINTICNENEREEYIEKVNKLLKLTHLYNYDLICVSAEDFMF